MWYFAWILGLGFAITLGILNAMWFELREGEIAAGETEHEPGPDQ